MQGADTSLARLDAMTQTLWVGCQTDDTHRAGLVRLEVDGTSARRTGEWETASSPGWLVEREGIVWACSLACGAELVSLRLTPDGPQELARLQLQGDVACHLALNPAGTLLAVACYASGSVSLVRVHGEGAMELLDVLEFMGHSGAVADRQEAPHPHMVHWKDDTRLLVCDLGADQVRRLRVDADTLTEVSPIELPDGFGPRHLVSRHVHEGLQLAIVGELTGQIATVAIDDDGWRPIGVFEGTRAGAGVPSGILLDEDGRLVIGQRGVNTIAWADWHEDGTVGPVQEVPTHGGEVRDLTLQPGAEPITVWTALLTRDAVAVLVEHEDGFRIESEEVVRQPLCLLWQ